MVNMTLSLPEQLHKKMKQHPELKWSDVARQAFEKKLKDMETLVWMDKVLANSKLTEKDVDEISHKIKADIRKRFDETFSRGH